MSTQKTHDLSGELARTRRYALTWFFCIVIGGMYLTWRLAGIDGWMWDNNAEFLDYQQYRQNRLAASSLPSESIDARTRGSVASAQSRASEVKR